MVGLSVELDSGLASGVSSTSFVFTSSYATADALVSFAETEDKPLTLIELTEPVRLLFRLLFLL